MKLSFYFSCLWLIAFITHAQTLKPGLWETTIKSTSESGQLEKSMPAALKSIEKLPKEQRLTHEDKMAKNAAQSNTENMTMKMCLTPAMAAEKVALPQAGAVDKNGCTLADVSRQANTIRPSFFCPYGDVHGERLVKLDGTSRHIVRDVSTMYVPMTTKGKADLFTTVSSVTFISPQCADIKPEKN